MIDLRLGRWESVLADVGEVDAVITDCPYGSRTHEGHNDGEQQMRDVTGQATRTALDYAHWSPADVEAFVDSWLPRTRGWFCAKTSHDLVMPYLDAMERHGRYAFAPVSIIQKRPRLLGDGPSSWTVYMCVCRPRTIEFSRWGCLPGAYMMATARDGVPGGKPLEGMIEIVRDYTRPGMRVADPCAGGATTLLAAEVLGLDSIGAEVSEETYAHAMTRIRDGGESSRARLKYGLHTPSMFPRPT